MATSQREWNQLWTNSCKHFLSGGVKEIVGLFIYFIYYHHYYLFMWI